jgi:hypothetical protein
MSVSCGVAVLSRLVDAPPILIEHLLTATGASENAPRKITANELDVVLRQFGLRLILVREWPRFGGPRLALWLALPSYLLAVLLVEERGRKARIGSWSGASSRRTASLRRGSRLTV